MRYKFKEGDRVKGEDGEYYIVVRLIGYFCDLRSADGLRSLNYIHEDTLTFHPIEGGV